MKVRMGSARCCCGEVSGCDNEIYSDEFNTLNQNWDFNASGFPYQNPTLSNGMLRFRFGKQARRCVFTFFEQRVFEYRIKGRVTKDASFFSNYPYGYSCATYIRNFNQEFTLQTSLLYHEIIQSPSNSGTMRHNLHVQYRTPRSTDTEFGPSTGVDLIVGAEVVNDPEPFDFGYKLTDNIEAIPVDPEVRFDYKFEVFWNGELVHTIPHLYFNPVRQSNGSLFHGFAVGQKLFTNTVEMQSKCDIDEFFYSAE